MATKHDDHKPDPNKLFESTELEPGPIVRFGVGLIVVAVIIYIACGGLFKLFEKMEADSNPPAYPLATERATMPPLPRLQPDEISEMQEFRKREAESIVNGKIDPATPGMPINEAIDKLITQGLPVRAAKDNQKLSEADRMPEDSSSGRTLERRLQ